MTLADHVLGRNDGSLTAYFLHAEDPNIVLSFDQLLVESNRKAMNRNWSNQKANPALKTKTGNE